MLGVHELGHTIQYGILSGLGTKFGNGVYGGSGLLGTTSAGQWWENNADFLGNLVY